MVRVNESPGDAQFKDEFLSLSVSLLHVNTAQEAALFEASALRFTRPEPPRDPDLPLLPPKRYPRYDAAQAERAISLMQPPPPMPGFIGRRAELEQAVTALLSGRPVVVTGSADIGKTALLSQLAHDPRLRGRFRRVWWLDMADDDALADAQLTLALAINAPFVLAAEPHAEQPRLIREQLIQMGVLVIMDNARTLDALKFCPTSLIALAQARAGADPLAAESAATIHLGGFDPQTAAATLARLTNRPPEEVESLSAAIGHHPRGVRFAAALVNEDDLTPDQLEAHLRHTAGDKLTGLYRTSLDALPAPYRDLLRVFVATPEVPIETEAILSRFEARLPGQRALRWLVRYGFLELLEASGTMGERVLAAGAWRALLEPAEEGFPAEVPVRERLTAPDIDDEAARRSRQLHDQGLVHLDALRDDEAEACLSEALKIRQSENMPYGVAETLTALARLAYLHGDDATAIRRLEAAAERLHDIRDEAGLAVLRLALSRAYRRAGRMEAALQVLDEDAPPEEVALVYRARQAWDEAAAVYQHLLAQAEAADDEAAHLAARQGLAETLAMAGRYPEALTIIGDHRLFTMQFLRGMILHLQGDVRGAIALYEQIYADAQPEHRAALARALARAKVRLVTPETREEVIREAAMLVGAEGIWYESRLPRPVFARQRLSYALYAHFALMLNDPAAAAEAADTALSLPGERTTPEVEAIAWRVIGRVCAMRGEWDAAQNAFEREVGARGDLPSGAGRDDYELGATLHALAEAWQACGEPDRAVANFRRALSYKDVGRDWRSVAQTQTALRDVLRSLGRKAEALEVGAHLIDLLNRQRRVDLAWIGNALAVQAQGYAEMGRHSPQFAQYEATLGAWLKRLSDRLEEALTHESWELRVLAAGLVLRSRPPLSDAEALVALAEDALALADAHAPGTLAAWAARRDVGDLMMRLERWPDAINAVAPLLDSPPEVQASIPHMIRLAHFHTARAHLRLGQPAQAAPHYEAVLPSVELPADRASLLREVADAFRAAGDDAHAADYDRRALEDLRALPASASYLETLLALGYDHIRLERYPEAIPILEEAARLIEGQRTPDRARLGTVLFDLGAAYATLGDHKRAATTFKEALHHQDTRQTRTKYAETLLAMAHSHLITESYGDALAAFHEALQYDTLSKDQRRAVLIEQAETFAKSRQPQAAIQAFNAAQALEVTAAEEQLVIHRGLAAAHTALGDHASARPHFAAVLAAGDGAHTGATWQLVADGHLTQKQFPEAIAAYLKALPYVDPTSEPSRLLTIQRTLGELYHDTRQPSAALRHLEIALDLEKAQPAQNAGRIARLLLRLADCHEQRSELERAIHRYHEALVYLDAKSAHAQADILATLIVLGGHYATLERWADSIKAYEEALALHLRQPSPDRARTEALRHHLAVGHARLGKLESAAELYRTVAKSPTASPVRDAAREALRALEAEIARHLQTLDVAEQSWALFRKTARPDLAELAFVRALQARTSASLGRDEDARRYAAMMRQLLKDRREDLLLTDQRPTIRALAAWLQGQEADEVGDASADGHYHRALETLARDPKANAALRWVLEQRGRLLA
jgi:tetratricopeptide (TPR) repeat protein